MGKPPGCDCSNNLRKDICPVCRCIFLENRLATVKAESARRLELLRELEWSAGSNAGNPKCAVCNMWSNLDHAPDCKLAKELS